MFLKEFLRNWKTVGAVRPSSPALAARMVRAGHVKGAKRVLELGPGTGAFTHAIREDLAPGSSYLGIERNATFVKRLSGDFPGLQFSASAIEEFDLDAHCREAGGPFDVVISGLPWTCFSEEVQRRILDHVLPRVAPDGRFVTFAYTGLHLLPAGQRFRSLLKTKLTQVRTTPTVWANVFPAFVYVGSKS